MFLAACYKGRSISSSYDFIDAAPEFKSVIKCSLRQSTKLSPIKSYLSGMGLSGHIGVTHTNEGHVSYHNIESQRTGWAKMKQNLNRQEVKCRNM